jgi:hypothetical protein
MSNDTRVCPKCQEARMALHLLRCAIMRVEDVELAGRDGEGKPLSMGWPEVECIDCGTTGRVPRRRAEDIAPSSNLAPL